LKAGKNEDTYQDLEPNKFLFKAKYGSKEAVTNSRTETVIDNSTINQNISESRRFSIRQRPIQANNQSEI
jgi:hypothetical protein